MCTKKQTDIIFEEEWTNDIALYKKKAEICRDVGGDMVSDMMINNLNMLTVMPFTELIKHLEEYLEPVFITKENSYVVPLRFEFTGLISLERLLCNTLNMMTFLFAQINYHTDPTITDTLDANLIVATACIYLRRLGEYYIITPYNIGMIFLLALLVATKYYIEVAIIDFFAGCMKQPLSFVIAAERDFACMMRYKFGVEDSELYEATGCYTKRNY